MAHRFYNKILLPFLRFLVAFSFTCVHFVRCSLSAGAVMRSWLPPSCRLCHALDIICPVGCNTPVWWAGRLAFQISLCGKRAWNLPEGKQRSKATEKECRLRCTHAVLRISGCTLYSLANTKGTMPWGSAACPWQREGKKEKSCIKVVSGEMEEGS